MVIRVKAGLLVFTMLLLSRLLGLLREVAVAGSFGATGVADAVILILSLPDWIVGVTVGGALSYVLLPAWAASTEIEVIRIQRSVANIILLFGVGCGIALFAFRFSLASLLLGTHDVPTLLVASQGLMWSAFAVPPALLAALLAARLQHEEDFIGLFGGNFVVNLVILLGIGVASFQYAHGLEIVDTGIALLLAMVVRVLWQIFRLSKTRTLPDAKWVEDAERTRKLPAVSTWFWAILSAGLPISLPFVARSVVSLNGEGSLAIFNYAWKLVELPLVLVIQLVTTLAFPAVAAAVIKGLETPEANYHVRLVFALTWVLACAMTAGLLIGSGALANFMFGWGRMEYESIVKVATLGRTAAWGLLPQALSAVSLMVLAAQQRMRIATVLYGLALGLLLILSTVYRFSPNELMVILNLLYVLVAFMVIPTISCAGSHCIPWGLMLLSTLSLLVVVATHSFFFVEYAGGIFQLIVASLAAVAVIVLTYVVGRALKIFPQKR